MSIGKGVHVTWPGHGAESTSRHRTGWCRLIAGAVSAWMVCQGSGCSPSGPTPEGESQLPATERSPATGPSTAVPAADDQPTSGIRFRDVTREAGIEFQRFDDFQGKHRLQEANGGGVAMLDYDRDGRLDLLFTNGCRLPVASSDERFPSPLYRNRGDIPFARVPESAWESPHAYLNGCAVGDFNDDGFDDVALTGYRRCYLFVNNGDGSWEDATEQLDVNPSRWTSSAAWGDLNGDGLLDLYVAAYVDVDDDPPTLCPTPGSPDGYVQCSPTLFEAEPDLAWLSSGVGPFTESAERLGLVAPDGKGLGVVLFDPNEDGLLDVYVANDGMPNHFYVQRDAVDPRYEEQALLAGIALNQDGKAEGSMGIACGDFDRDGGSDLFLTHFFAETNTLYASRDLDTFEDATAESGLGPVTRQMLGFGTVAVDFDHDGWLDLFVGNGHIDDFSWSNPYETYAMPPQVFTNRGGERFEDVSSTAGEFFAGEWVSRGVAAGDLDRDGDVDLAISNQWKPSAVLRNESALVGQALRLRLIGAGPSNRNAIGARVLIPGVDPLLKREVVGGGSFQSASSYDVHIGLAETSMLATIEIWWPSGQAETVRDVPAGVPLLIVEGTGRFLMLAE